MTDLSYKFWVDTDLYVDMKDKQSPVRHNQCITKLLG